VLEEGKDKMEIESTNISRELTGIAGRKERLGVGGQARHRAKGGSLNGP